MREPTQKLAAQVQPIVIQTVEVGQLIGLHLL